MKKIYFDHEKLNVMLVGLIRSHDPSRLKEEASLYRIDEAD